MLLEALCAVYNLDIFVLSGSSTLVLSVYLLVNWLYVMLSVFLEFDYDSGCFELGQENYASRSPSYVVVLRITGSG